jgi:hypothetical protein
MRPRSPCGTHAAYSGHRRRGERPCLACCEAQRLWTEDRRHAAERRAVLAEAVGSGSYGGRAS